MEIKIGWIFFWIFLIVQLLNVFNRLPKFIEIISNILRTLLAIWIFIFGPIYFSYLAFKEPPGIEQSLFRESRKLGKSIKREDAVISLYNVKILKIMEVEYSGAGSIIYSHLILRI